MEHAKKNSRAALIMRNDKSNMFINTHLLKPAQEDKRVKLMKKLLENTQTKPRARMSGGSLDHSLDKLQISEYDVGALKIE